jgi:hypothetical protein
MTHGMRIEPDACSLRAHGHSTPAALFGAQRYLEYGALHRNEPRALQKRVGLKRGDYCYGLPLTRVDNLKEGNPMGGNLSIISDMQLGNLGSLYRCRVAPQIHYSERPKRYLANSHIVQAGPLERTQQAA